MQSIKTSGDNTVTLMTDLEVFNGFNQLFTLYKWTKTELAELTEDFSDSEKSSGGLDDHR